ncbi:unnamed protein product [Paramecium primaurelia]|uniref:Uncharacterized protein n=1 Tax=Paramecium primaurelia TaxID=5886 RepID=A0A8S1NHS3_PARPR|nr:unnamed protein product [Paramecium primaurelia]
MMNQRMVNFKYMRNMMDQQFMDNYMVKERDGMQKKDGFILDFGKSQQDVEQGSIMQRIKMKNLN